MMLVRFHRLVERTAERYEVNSPLVLLKEVAGAHAAPLVMSMFPRSKLVFLVRDGRDVVDSQTAANQPGGWMPVRGWKTAEERHEFIRRRARTWVGDVASIERAFEAHPPELRRMVRYEDLLAGPAENLGSLVEWLGLPQERAVARARGRGQRVRLDRPRAEGPEEVLPFRDPGGLAQEHDRRGGGDARERDGGQAPRARLSGRRWPIRCRRGSRTMAVRPIHTMEPSRKTRHPRPEVARRRPAPARTGRARHRGDIVSAAIRRHGEGRDYSESRSPRPEAREAPPAGAIARSPSRSTTARSCRPTESSTRSSASMPAPPSSWSATRWMGTGS